jgi:hypothetical protein
VAAPLASSLIPPWRNDRFEGSSGAALTSDHRKPPCFEGNYVAAPLLWESFDSKFNGAKFCAVVLLVSRVALRPLLGFPETSAQLCGGCFRG